MLLHFKLNCFIFLMLLVGQINLGEKVSRNIDAFFDPSVDNIQDNFYDIPFIDDHNNNIQQQNNQELINEHEIFQFGRDELLQTNQNEEYNENEFNKRDCPTNTSDVLLDSIVEEFNKIGRKKNSLYLKMKNIEEDEAILENKRQNLLRKIRRFEEPSTKRPHRFVNSIHFVHKYRHKNAKNNVNKRTCNKLLKMPHKHRPSETSFRASKHEIFKDDLVDGDGGCTGKPNQTDCNAPKKQKNTAVESPQDKKHKQLKAKQTTNAPTTKSSIPPTKDSIKSVLCHKHSKTTKSKEFDEYEDYKVDYNDDKFRKKNEKQRNCETTIKLDSKKPLERFLEQETTQDFATGLAFHHSPSDYKEEVIDKFLKKETTRSDFTISRSIVRRNLPATDTDTDTVTERKPPVNKIEQFLKSETIKAKKHQIKHKINERYRRKKVKNKRDFLLRRTPFLLTPLFDNKRRLTTVSQEMVNLIRTNRQNIYIASTKNDEDEEEPPNIKQQVYIVKPKKKDEDNNAKNVVKITEMNNKLYNNQNQNQMNDIYVQHTKNQGRQHHRIYYEREREKLKKAKQKIDVFEAKNDYEHPRQKTTFLERLKHSSDSDEDELTTEIEISNEISHEIDELYKEIPVNRKHIELSSNCDNNDYINKDHCICSVKQMLRDLMDDLKDINSSMNYQYDCTKYIGIQPGIVIANDSVLLRNKRLLNSNENILLRRGSRIGRDVDTLLNELSNVDNIDNEIYAIVGSKVEMNCGNVSSNNEDDKFVWSVSKGVPETAGIKEDNGRKLIIERVGAQDTNNYTCEISHRLEDGSYGPSTKFLHKLSVVEIPIYNIMVTVLLNESARCEQQDIDTLHQYYPIMLKKFLCSANDQFCHISLDNPHCTTNNLKNGITMHATLKTAPLYTLLPALKKRQQDCGISCQSRVYSIIVKTMLYNFASITNLPVFFRDNQEHKKFLPVQYEIGDKSNVFSNSILTICPLGFGILQNNEKLCIACEPHTYNPGNKKDCLSCPSGSYQPNYGSGSCLPCTSPLDNARCLFGSRAEISPKLYFIMPIILVFALIALIICCIYSTKSAQTNKIYSDEGETIQTKVIEQVFTGEPSDKSYSTVVTHRPKSTSEKRGSIKKSLPPPPPPVDFN